MTNLNKKQQAAARKRCNPGREPYSKTDYVSLLILCDSERLARQEAALGICPRCHEALPAGCNSLFKGGAACWFTRDFRRLNLTAVTGHAQLSDECEEQQP